MLSYEEMLAVLQQWYQAAREHPSYTNDQKKRINSFCGALKMSLGKLEAEEHIDNVYSAGLGWQRHFMKLLGKDVGSSGPEDLDNLA